MLRIRLNHMLRAPEFKLTFVFSAVLMLLATIQQCAAAYGQYAPFVEPANQQFIGFLMVYPFYKWLLYSYLLPLIATFAYAHNYYTDCKSGMLLHFLMRKSRTRYFFSGALAAFLAAFALVFLALGLQQLAMMVAVPLHSSMLADTHCALFPFEDVPTLLFPSLFLNAPYLYSLLYIFLPALGAGLMGLFAYSISLFFHKKSKLLVIGLVPALYLLWALVAAATGHPEFTVAYYFDASGAAVYNMSARFIAPAALAVLGVSLGLTALRCRLRDELN